MHSLPRLTSQSISNQPTHIDSLSKNKLHFGQNLMFKIHKQALSEYLKSGVIDQRIVQLNLLKMSKLKTDELLTLNDIYSQTISSRVEKQQAQHILSKIKTSRNPKIIFPNDKNYNEPSQEELEFMTVEDQLKQCLKSKINTSKVFNGTYLVDPTINDLKKNSLSGRKQLHYLLNLEPKKKSQKKIQPFQRQSSILNPQYCKKSSIQSIEVEDVTEFMSSKMLESKANIDQLVERFKQPELTEAEQLFFQLVQNCDCKALNQLLTDKQLPSSVINTSDQKGFYAIHIAIKKQNFQLVQILLKNGARTDVLTKNGKTVTQLCELYYNQEIYDLLVPKKSK